MKKNEKLRNLNLVNLTFGNAALIYFKSTHDKPNNIVNNYFKCPGNLHKLIYSRGSNKIIQFFMTALLEEYT